MSKQAFDNVKYSPKAWEPLKNFIYSGTQEEVDRKILRLRSFGPRDRGLIICVACCLWKLANGANLPWGRGALQPSLYSAIPAFEKVNLVEYNEGCILYIYIFLLTPYYNTHIFDRRGLSLVGFDVSWVNPRAWR